MANTLPIGDTISAAWNKIYGVKTSFWAAVIVSYLISLGLTILSSICMHILFPLGVLATITSVCVFILLQIGLYYMGILRADNQPIHYKQIYFPLSAAMRLNTLGLILAQSLIMVIPGMIAYLATCLMNHADQNDFFALIAVALYVASLLLAIYLILGMLLAMGYVLTKNMAPIEALTNSYKHTQSHLFELFVIYIIFSIIYFLLGLPFGIGLIWGIPFSYVLYGEIFLRLAKNS
jgi:hypothetical protein